MNNQMSQFLRGLRSSAQSMNRTKSFTHSLTQRIPTQSFSQSASSDVQLKKNPMRFFLAFLGLNGIFAYAYYKKRSNENRFTIPIQQKLKDFTEAYQANPNSFSQAQIEALFDEFLVENVAITLSEKSTEQIRAISQSLCEKYPKSREIQFFASEVSQYERRAIYLKGAMVADRKYIDEVLVRQMALTCSRFGNEKPFFFDEFFSACTKYSLQNKQDEANLCLESYLKLNPPNYVRAAIQRVRNDVDSQHYARLLATIEDLFTREHSKAEQFNQKEKDYVLSFLSALPLTNELANREEQLKAAQLLMQGSNPLLSQRFVKAVLDSDSQNADALKIQASIFERLNEVTLMQKTNESVQKIEAKQTNQKK